MHAAEDRHCSMGALSILNHCWKSVAWVLCCVCLCFFLACKTLTVIQARCSWAAIR